MLSKLKNNVVNNVELTFITRAIDGSGSGVYTDIFIYSLLIMRVVYCDSAPTG